MKRYSKFLSMLLLFTMLFTQVLSFGSIGSVSAKERNNNYSNIVPGKIIVKYKDEESPTVVEYGTQGVSVNQYSSLNVREIELPESQDVFEAIKEYESDPNVEFAEPVYIYRKVNENHTKNSSESVMQSVYNPSDTEYQNGSQDNGLGAIDITAAWKKVSFEDREKITIAVIDGLIDLEHEDIKDSLVDGYDFVRDEIIDSNYAYDFADDHGTHVAGIAAAVTDNNTGIAGTAGGVKIMPLQVFDGDTASGKDVYEAILWAVEEVDVDVINLSLGKDKYLLDENGDYILDEHGNKIDTYSEYEQLIISYALQEGVVVVAATGNESNHWIEGEAGDTDSYAGQEQYTSPVIYPAAYNGVIGVGAVDTVSSKEPIIADFSNIGDEVDVVAPGISIYSTYANNEYGNMSGTSMSTPFVSGLAALILAANPDLTAYEVNNIIYETSVDLGDKGEDNYFGYGLIDGKNAFNTPRLELSVQIDDKKTVTDAVYYSVYMKDYAGDNVLENGEADLSLYSYDYNIGDWEQIDDTVINILDGQREGKITLPEIGQYAIYVDENDEDDNKWIWSNSEYVRYQPKTPTSDIAPGKYSSTQSITLTTATPDAKIYYTTNGDEPTSNSAEYVNPISISSSTTIKAIAVKNYIESEVGTFAYRISSGGGGSGGGGGGGGGGTSKKVTVVKVSEEKIKEIKEGKKETVVIEVESESDKNKDFSVELPSDVLKLAKDNNKTIKIKSKNVTIYIEPGLLEINDEKATVKLTVKALKESKSDIDKKDKYADGVSEVFDFALDIDDTKISEFKKPVKITMEFDNSKAKDKNKLGVYYFNEDTDNWDYVGGNVNEDGTITFETEHFSKYTVMEYNKSFTDISDHWAKYDIEVMASKHIANGITEETFAPNKNITRAEFASLLTRALDLPIVDSKPSFTDVDNAWYSDAVKSAYSAKIINGIDDTQFAPNQNITREQMAAMLIRAYTYATGKKIEDLYTTAEVKFSDEGAVSKWARSNVRLAASLKLMNGKTDKAFVPKDNATRAEAITVIKRLLEEIND